MASAYLSKTAAGAGNNTTGTFSCWFKRANAGTTQRLYQHTTDNDHFMEIGVNGSNKLFVYCYDNPTNLVYLATSRVFQDFSAWYHVVAAFDSTQSTNTDRAKVYINGQQVTSFSSSTYPSSQNADLFFNKSGQTQYIASNFQSGYRWDGMIAHLHWADGQFYDASVFGQTDSNGVWIPKTAPTVSYGTNGHFIKFDNSANMGLDSSGQSNNFTTSGSVIQVKDSPTNIYTCLNLLDVVPANSNTFTNVNSSLSTNDSGSRSTFAPDSGKWYAEAKMPSSTSWLGVQDQSIYPSALTNSVLLYPNGASLYVDGSNQGSGGYGSAWSANDIMMIAMDLTSTQKKVYFGKNGGWWTGSDYTGNSPSTGVNLSDNINYAFRSSSGSGTQTTHWNFGNGYFGTTAVSSAGSNGNGSVFEYDVPTGYYALNTENLKEQS